MMSMFVSITYGYWHSTKDFSITCKLYTNKYLAPHKVTGPDEILHNTISYYYLSLNFAFFLWIKETGHSIKC